jgi:hypothetical protein
MLVEQAGRSFALGLYCTAHSVREIVIELARVSRIPIALSLESQARHTCIRKGSLMKYHAKFLQAQTTPPKTSWRRSWQTSKSPTYRVTFCRAGIVATSYS